MLHFTFFILNFYRIKVKNVECKIKPFTLRLSEFPNTFLEVTRLKIKAYFNRMNRIIKRFSFLFSTLSIRLVFLQLRHS